MQQFHSLVPIQSTVSQQAEMILNKHSLTSYILDVFLENERFPRCLGSVVGPLWLCWVTDIICACLGVTCHLYFWQNDCCFLCAMGVKWTWNKSQRRKLTLKKKNFPLLLLGIKPVAFQSQVWCSNKWAILITCITMIYWRMYLLQLSHPDYMYKYDILKSVLIATEPSWLHV